MRTIKITPSFTRRAAVIAATFIPIASGYGQAGTPTPAQEEEAIVLSPFEVTTDENEGYSAATTFAGNRLNTELRDIGNAVTVVTGQFLADTAAVNNESLLQYTVGTEVGSVSGNFAGVGDGAQLNDRFLNPNQNTRVRGLTSADNTRDFFLTNIPWDGYNVDRVDLQRGPNSILFGQGSPAGIINTGTKTAAFNNSGEVEFRFGSFGSTRISLDLNVELLDDELAVRFSTLRDSEKFKQDPAFELDRRFFGALRWEPNFLKKGSVRTIFRANFESGDIESNRPRVFPPGDYITPWFLTGSFEGRFDRRGSLILGTDPLGRASVRAGDVRVFQNLNKLTTNLHISANDNFYRPNFQHGLIRPAINGGPFGGFINPYYNPWIGSFGASIGGPIAYFPEGETTTADYWSEEIRALWGINSTSA
ncbi:MAG TPA: TonB-dependent receptor plug domain-containing protein, partial [Opitutaceae bacterium]